MHVPHVRYFVCACALTLGLSAAAKAEDNRKLPAPLPAAPDGVALRQVAAFDPPEQEPVRIAAHPNNGKLYVLGGGGDVTLIDLKQKSQRRVLTGTDYIDQPKRDNVNLPFPLDRKLVNAPLTMRATLALGLAFDRERRMYTVVNIQMPGKILVNRVAIYRTPPVDANGVPSAPTLWTRFDYPYGVGTFNHGACGIAQGPDGKIYLGSGSRTDHGETGTESNISRNGEGPHPDVPGGPGFQGGEFTAVMLRFDPAKGQQVPEVFARGLRNPFGFDWDDKGRLIVSNNGPTADHPEPLDYVQQGKHYGFPYVFGDHEKPNYPDSPKAPPGLKIEPPIRNVGLAGLIGDHAIYTFTPHSSPDGLVFYRSGDLPKEYDNNFFVARFGNLVGHSRIGFDVLNFRLSEEGGQLVAHTDTFLSRLGRPIDLCISGGKLYILEYCRQTESQGPGSEGWNEGGRVLEASGQPVKQGK